MGDLPRNSVSILLPTYNGERFLAQQIDSILDQSHQDFELLAIDDGSTDASVQLLDDYATRDRRIRIVPSNGNRGQSDRLAELLKEARGQFISVSDQDDIWDPYRTERLLQGIDGVNLSFGRSDLIDASGKPMGLTLLGSLGITPHPDDRLIALFQPAVSGHAMLARREVVTETAFRRILSYDWLIGLDALFSTGWRYVDDAIVNHRIHDRNQLNGPNVRRSQAEQGMGKVERLLWQARPRRRAARRREHRRRVAHTLEHVACSPFVPIPLRRACLRLWNRSTASWYRAGPLIPARGRQLRALFIELLEPHAQSDSDWRKTLEQIERLT